MRRTIDRITKLSLQPRYSRLAAGPRRTRLALNHRRLDDVRQSLPGHLPRRDAATCRRPEVATRRRRWTGLRGRTWTRCGPIRRRSTRSGTAYCWSSSTASSSPHASSVCPPFHLCLPSSSCLSVRLSSSVAVCCFECSSREWTGPTLKCALFCPHGWK